MGGSTGQVKLLQRRCERPSQFSPDLSLDHITPLGATTRTCLIPIRICRNTPTAIKTTKTTSTTTKTTITTTKTTTEQQQRQQQQKGYKQGRHFQQVGTRFPSVPLFTN